MLNALDPHAYGYTVNKYKVDTIFNLVALLSAVGEKDPQLAWNINMGALMNSLDIARQYGCSLFTPSSIGAFGLSSPKERTPQDTLMRPNTIYGVCKVTGELLSDYYHSKYGVDTRSVRFPGIISSVTLPGGGTTDYAVEIFYDAVENGPLRLSDSGRRLYGHDVHARRAERLRATDGGRSGPSGPSQCFQYHVDELHSGRYWPPKSASICPILK